MPERGYITPRIPQEACHLALARCHFLFSSTVPHHSLQNEWTNKPYSGGLLRGFFCLLRETRESPPRFCYHLLPPDSLFPPHYVEVPHSPPTTPWTVGLIRTSVQTRDKVQNARYHPGKPSCEEGNDPNYAILRGISCCCDDRGRSRPTPTKGL